MPLVLRVTPESSGSGAAAPPLLVADGSWSTRLSPSPLPGSGGEAQVAKSLCSLSEGRVALRATLELVDEAQKGAPRVLCSEVLDVQIRPAAAAVPGVGDAAVMASA